jgi:hypothetical protein
MHATSAGGKPHLSTKKVAKELEKADSVSVVYTM